eukprot:scaffold61_cov205-Alexandrium_tamarense.AAC.14
MGRLIHPYISAPPCFDDILTVQRPTLGVFYVCRLVGRSRPQNPYKKPFANFINRSYVALIWRYCIAELE